jgi:Excalibur calcium-binding domain
LGGAVAASAFPTAAKKFANCTALNAKYKNGIASDYDAVERADWAEKKRPSVSASVYRANKKLDKNGLGYICPKSRPNLGYVSGETNWGTFKLEKVSAPGFNKCVYPRLKLDILHPEQLSNSYWELDIRRDDITYLSTFVLTDWGGGKNIANMQICSYDWTFHQPAFTYSGTLTMKQYQPARSYHLNYSGTGDSDYYIRNR